MERGIVKCLYDLAKHLKTKPSVISGEKKHLSSVFRNTQLIHTLLSFLFRFISIIKSLMIITQ